MSRYAVWAQACAILFVLGCGGGNSSKPTVSLPFINASSDFAQVVPLIEGGVFAAMHAVNATGKFYNGYSVQAAEKSGIGNAIGGDPNDTLAEQALVDQMESAVHAKILLGPATWSLDQDFCTVKQYLCISHSAATVRDDPNYIYSFTTAGYYPGWVLGTAYDISVQSPNANVLYLADYDTSFDTPQMERFGITITNITLPGDDPNNWASEPNSFSPSGYASQIISANPNAVILESSAPGVAAIYQALLNQDPNFPINRIWIGGETNLSDFVLAVGNTASPGINKVYEEFKDTSSSSYQAYLNQYQAWGNSQPTGDWELSAYWAAMLGAYAVHAEMVNAHATDSTTLSGTDLRTQLLNLTNPADPNATPYWISDTANILTAISNHESIHVQGFGLPFSFSADGRAIAPCQKEVCPSNCSTPTVTPISSDTILNAMH